MYIESITFDRVFSVVRRNTRHGKYTTFGFETGERKVYEARVHGHPEVGSGMTVTLAMSKPEDWTNIYGWINRAENTVAIGEGIEEQLGPALILLAHLTLVAPLVILNWPYMGNEKWLIGFFGLFLPSLLGFLFFRSKFRVTKARRLLTAMLARPNNAA